MNRTTSFLAIILLLVLASSTIGFGQTKQPISFEGILQLPNFGMSAKQIADQIAESGLTFEVTKAHIDSLQKLGFDRSVINAVKQYYRMGILKIATIPAQVEVFVDNESRGMSDTYGIWQGEVPRGSHSVKLAKRGFAETDTSITVIKDRTINLQISLQKGGAAGTKFFGRYGASVGFGFSVSSPSFDSIGSWKGGNNIIFGVKANVMPYLFVDLDLNLANFGKFDADGGDDFGSLNAFNISIIPGVYKEFNEKYRAVLGLGLELNSSKIKNGKFEDDGVAYMLDEKGSKSSLALLLKLGGEALVQENIFLFAEYRGYSVLGNYAMSFIAVGAGIYVK